MGTKAFEKIYSIDQLNETALELFQNFEPAKIFCFIGGLGSGKTTFISSLCKLLGCLDTVSSPTFSIVNEYKIPGDIIYHFDLYRLKNLEETLDIGFEEYVYSGKYCFIEWPEKVTKILPASIVVYCELSYLSSNERKLKAWTN